MRQTEESFADILEGKLKSAEGKSNAFGSADSWSDVEDSALHFRGETLAQELGIIQLFLGSSQKFRFQGKQKYTYKTASPSKDSIVDSINATEEKPELPPAIPVPRVKAALLDAKSYDAYQYLCGLSPLALAFSESELKKCYRKIALAYHPDRNPRGQNTFVQARESYQLLRNCFC